MLNQVNKSIYSKFTKRFFVVFGIILFVVIFFGLIREYVKEKELDSSIDNLEDELVQLKLDKKDFLDSVSAYQQDHFVEQEARDKFNLKRPGEKVYIVDTINGSGEVEDEFLENSKFVQSNPVAWWNYFFGDK